MVCGVTVEGRSALSLGKYRGGVLLDVTSEAVMLGSVQLHPVSPAGLTTSLTTFVEGEHGGSLHAAALFEAKSNRRFSESRTAFRMLPVSVITVSVGQQLPKQVLEASA